VTKRALAKLSGGAAEAAQIEKRTRAKSVEAAGADGWWIFVYETPRDALLAARWMTETAKLEATPLFERMRFRRQETPTDSPIFSGSTSW